MGISPTSVHVPVLITHLRTSDLEAALPFHAGLTLTPAELGTICIGEWLVHGYELAKTVGLPWQVQPEPAALLLFFYRRTGLWSNVARGAMIAGGRRPLRALSLRKRFHPA